LEFKEELKEKQTKEYVTPKAKQEALERTQTKIQETREKIKLIEERIKGVDCCDICFDDINNPAVTGCCQNVFCFSCLAIAISGKNICPKCRDSLTLDKIMIINKKSNDGEGEGEGEDDNGYGDGTGDRDGVDGNMKDEIKIRELALKEVLDNSLNNDKYTNFEKIIEYKVKNFPKEKRKILVFSEHEGSFNAKITGVLDKFNINYSRIKGTSASINKTLREYRGDDLKPGDKEIDVLLINSRFFGAGLNLQNSSDIIILHRQGADLLHQIIGRAQRIGRKDPLNIWKLYNNNEAYNYTEA
jgi:SNF2 family DNA or RNA helicase